MPPGKSIAVRLFHAAAPPLALFALNVAVAGRLFSLAYIHFMSSIEGVYVSIAAQAMRHWDLWWWTFWFGGAPYQNTHPPLLPLVTAAIAALFNVTPALAFHAASGFFYCLAPVCAYVLALRLSRSRGYAFVAGLAWSLVSPSAWLIPSISREIGGPWHARRLEMLAFYGDAPHIAALSLVPLAIVCLDVALARRRPIYYLLAALSMAAVLLTDWAGAIVLGLGTVTYLAARSTLRRHDAGATNAGATAWLTGAAVIVLACSIASPWAPPSTIYRVQQNAQTIGGDFRGVYRTWLIAAPLLAAALLLLKYLLARLKASLFLQFGILFTLLTGTVTFAWEWFGVVLAIQPARYHLAMELGVCLAAAAAAQAVLARLPVAARRALAAIALLIAVVQIVHYRAHAAYLLQPAGMNERIEYKTAKWFDRNMNGARVMASGGTSFWMNAFTATPQLAGLDEAATNWVARVAVYTVHSGENAGAQDAGISVLWLKAFGVHAVAVSGPGSQSYYKPYRNPHKFDGVLPALWRDGDDTVYYVPARSMSLAHAVSRGDLVSRRPVHGLDVAEVRRYVAALDDPARPLAPFAWRGNRRASIVATLRPDDLLSVQISWHAGWHARVNGEPRNVFPDGLGLIVVAPKCDGPCVVDLYYDGGMEMLLARLASFGSLAVCLIWVLYPVLRSPGRILPRNPYGRR